MSVIEVLSVVIYFYLLFNFIDKIAYQNWLCVVDFLLCVEHFKLSQL